MKQTPQQASYRILRHAQEDVREKLKQKCFDDVSLTSYGRLDEFISFLVSFGFSRMLAQLGISTGKSGIPVFLLAMLSFIRPLLGIRFIDNMKYLFGDPHLLVTLGFTLQQIKEGYSKRTGKDGSKPIHPDTVRNFLSSLSYPQSMGLSVKVVRKLVSIGFILGGLYALDSKTVFKEGISFQFAKKVLDYRGNRKNRRAYKITVLQNLKSKAVVLVMLTPANWSDNRIFLLAVKEAVTILGKGVIKILLIDKGYYDGEDLRKLKYDYGIDFIVPGKQNLKLVKEYKQKTNALKKVGPGLEIASFKDVEGLPNYDHPVNVLLVRDKKAKKKRFKKIPLHIYLTSLDWECALAIYKAYRNRWTIENNAIRELNQEWLLSDFPSGDINAIRAHLVIALISFNLHLLFRSKYGRRFVEKELVARRVPAAQKHYVIVYVEDMFGIFTIQEFTYLTTGVKGRYFGQGPPDR